MSRGRWLLRAWAGLVLVLAVRLLWQVLVRQPGCGLAFEPLCFDPNEASVEELQLLPGVGRARAEGIVLERIRRGPFRALEDLSRVDGIGAETIRAIGRFLDIPTRASTGTAGH